MTVDIQDGILQSWDSPEEIVRIPDEVQAISAWAFRHSEIIREVYLPEGVTVLEDNAFKQCSSLRKVVLPDSLTTIGEGVFAYCQGLEEVILGNQVEEIACGAFFNCKRLRQIRLPETLREIGNGAFHSCSGLREIVLPKAVRSIGNYAFCHTGITDLVLPKGLQWTGPGILQDCMVRHLTIQGSRTRPQTICRDEDLQEDAMLTADGREIAQYPEPFTAVHALRDFVFRRAAGEMVPAATEDRLRAYLAEHYLQHLEEPLIMQLIRAWKAIPLEQMDAALQKVSELGKPALTAALLQYQHEVFPQKQVGEQWRRRMHEEDGTP